MKVFRKTAYSRLPIYEENIEKVLEELDRERHYEDISDAVTVSGWVMEIMGKIPEKGESFQYRDFQGTVLEMDGRRVGKIHMKRK